ncbi:MAG: hypothetical protein K2K73_03555, partial [Ureaplasma sp.]|nr:hypothetical protein [Ureaplasma sp.]
NILEFKSKLLTYKLIDINLFNKTKIYSFRDKLYQKWLIKTLKKIKFKSEQQIINKYYLVFLKYSHFFIFNLTKSNINFDNEQLLKICDQILNNLIIKIGEDYQLKIK